MADALENRKATLRAKFDKLSPEDFMEVKGNKDALIDKVVEKHGLSKEEATKQVEETLASTA